MTLKDPEAMVAEELKKQYKSWLVKHLPWNLSDFSWARTYIRQRNMRTGKVESTKKLIDDLKKESKSGYDAIVIATDTDPSVRVSYLLGRLWMRLAGGVKCYVRTLWMSQHRAFKRPCINYEMFQIRWLMVNMLKVKAVIGGTLLQCN
jgi:hypothetical protein